MDHPCEHNEAVVCDHKNCHRCGWNPEVAKARLNSVRRSLIDNQKLYKIPFTGYCEVWASSPEEAVEAADKDEMFFVHYDFGNPVCKEKEEKNE